MVEVQGAQWQDDPREVTRTPGSPSPVPARPRLRSPVSGPRVLVGAAFRGSSAGLGGPAAGREWGLR